MVIKPCSPFLPAQKVESFDLVTALLGVIAQYVYALYYIKDIFASI